MGSAAALCGRRSRLRQESPLDCENLFTLRFFYYLRGRKICTLCWRIGFSFDGSDFEKKVGEERDGRNFSNFSNWTTNSSWKNGERVRSFLSKLKRAYLKDWRYFFQMAMLMLLLFTWVVVKVWSSKDIKILEIRATKWRKIGEVWKRGEDLERGISFRLEESTRCRRGNSVSNRQATQDFSSFPRVYPRKVSEEGEKGSSSCLRRLCFPCSRNSATRLLPGIPSAGFCFRLRSIIFKCFHGEKLFIKPGWWVIPLGMRSSDFSLFMLRSTRDKRRCLKDSVRILCRSSSNFE